MGWVIVLSVATMPLMGLIGAVRDRSEHRRSRFWARLAGLVVCAALPWLIGGVVRVGEQAFGVLLFAGLAWALLLVALAPMLLFDRRGSEPGPSDDQDGGHGPEDDPPQRPIDRSPRDAESYAALTV